MSSSKKWKSRLSEMSAGKCKRVAASSSDDDSPCSDDTTITTTTDTEPALPALTTDHDYDASSPGSSSTLSSGGGDPSVMRLPGFTHHSQDTPRRPRMKKKKADMNVEDSLCSHNEQAAGQLACSRLAKPQQLTPRTKAARGT